jgi:perosamine synthetase
VLTKLYPRLQLDIEWSDLASVFVPLSEVNGEWAVNAVANWPSTSQFCLSVRTGFDTILGLLNGSDHNAAQSATIVMSGINIANMTEIAQRNGWRIVSVDIEYTTLSPQIEVLRQTFELSRPKAYLHAHLFGARSDVSEIARLCEDYGVFFIEDCAQAWAADALQRPPVSDVALYSFGPIKAYTCLGGAVCVFKDGDFSSRFEQALRKLPRKSEGWFRRRALKMAMLKYVSSPRAYRAIMTVLSWLGLNSDQTVGAAARGFSGADILKSIRFRPPVTMLRLAARRFDMIGTVHNWRSEASQVLNRQLSSLGILLGDRADIHSHWLYPVLSQCPNALIMKLRRQGFDATRGATSLKAVCGSEQRPMPLSQALMDGVVYLPFSPAMSQASLSKLARIVSKTESLDPR